jgi:hypothetical protein
MTYVGAVETRGYNPLGQLTTLERLGVPETTSPQLTLNASKGYGYPHTVTLRGRTSKVDR